MQFNASLLRIGVETYILCNSYTMACPHVHGDNPRALASGLSYAQVDKHRITILYHLYQCRPCTSRGISCSVGKAGINVLYGCLKSHSR